MFRTSLLCIATLVTVLFAMVAAKADDPSPDPFGEPPGNDPFAEPADDGPAAPSYGRSSSERIHKRRCCAPVMLGRVSRAERSIYKALRKPTQLDFKQTPLRDVVDFLKEYHKIEIQIDNKALADVGLTPDEMVDKNLRGISLRSALRLMLRDLDLTYLIQDEVLLITTPEEAEYRLTTMFYPVAELLAEGDRPGSFSTDGDTLIGMIQRLVQPLTWDATGGPGAIMGVSIRGVDMLVISSTAEVHEEVTELLHTLCRVAKVPSRSK